MSDTPKYLVTGGTGFIGSHFVRALVAMGLSPLVCTRTAEPGRVVDGARYRAVDLGSSVELRAVFEEERPAVVVHLAGVRGRGPGVVTAQVETNVAATVRVVDTASLYGVQRIITIGSADEYGSGFAGELGENLPVNPVSSYGITKAAATRLLLAMHRDQGAPVVVLRPFSVYGPGQPLDMFIAEAVDCALRNVDFKMTEGHQRRDFVYVDDFIRALLAAAVAPGIEGSVINVASGVATPLRDVAQLIWQITGAEAKLRIGDRPATDAELHDTWAHISLANSLLNWKPEIDLESGLRRTVEAARLRTNGLAAEASGSTSGNTLDGNIWGSKGERCETE